MKIKKYIRNLIGFYDLEKKANLNNNISNEILWANIFNNTITDSSWLIIKSLSPGRWAMGYPGLYILYRILNDVRPNNILEFGLGESTKMTYQYVTNLCQQSSLTVIEQDENWLNYFSTSHFDVAKCVKLLPIITTQINGKSSNIYNNLIPSIDSKKYNLIIIDGPWGSIHYSRYQINDIIANSLLDDDFIILMDDYERSGERETVNKIIDQLNNKGINFKQGIYSGVKETTIICSENYGFLVSL